MDMKETIKESLINACLQCRPNVFKKFLFSKNVTTGFPSKEGFYEFFHYMLSSAKKTSVGNLRLSVYFPETKNNELKEYRFYDSKNNYCHFSVIIDEKIDKLHLYMLPF